MSDVTFLPNPGSVRPWTGERIPSVLAAHRLARASLSFFTYSVLFSVLFSKLGSVTEQVQSEIEGRVRGRKRDREKEKEERERNRWCALRRARSKIFNAGLPALL